MTLEELLKELQALIDKCDGAGETTDEDAERMDQLTKQIEEIRSANAKAAETRAATVAAARKAIDSGRAQVVASTPVARSAGIAYDTTDYSKHQRSAWAKRLAASSGVELYGGTELTDVERNALNMMREERTAFTHLTSNTTDIVPVEVQNEIITLVDNTAVFFGDARHLNFKHQYDLPRHKAITTGDAATTAEGAAPANEEQNEFDTFTLTGEEIKKTVKLSRKMAVQSLEGFEQYIIAEVGARLAVAANAMAHRKSVDPTLGMASENKLQTAKSGVLTLADMRGMFAKLKNYGNPCARGIAIYANNNTIWNYLAAMEDKNGHAYFIESERTDDPAVVGTLYGRPVKMDDSMEENIIKAGYRDLHHVNIFDDIDVRPYIENGTAKHCFDGYMLADSGIIVPEAFAQMTIVHG